MGEGHFKNCTEEEQRIIENFPTLTKENLEEANSLFEPYIFYRTEKEGQRLWTSCCHVAGKLLPFLGRTETDRERIFLASKHNDAVRCPFCGRPATKKCVGRIGHGKNLREYKYVIFLHNRENALYAQAYVVRKDYDALQLGDKILSQKPGYYFKAAYRFSQGCAMQVTRDCWSDDYVCAYERETLRRKKNVAEPFVSYDGLYIQHEGYSLIGAEALQDGFAKYSQYEAWWRSRPAAGYTRKHSALIGYLTAYAVYPRQIEMLVKAGLSRPVCDLIFERKKNARVMDWKQTDPRKAFGISGQDLKDLLAGGVPGDQAFRALGYLRDLRRAGEKLTLRDVLSAPDGGLGDLLRDTERKGQYKELFRRCARLGVKPGKLCRYLEKFTGQRCYGGYFGIGQAWTLWRDTMELAGTLGFDAEDQAVAFPSGLEAKHQEYQELLNERKKREQEARDEERAASAKKLEKLLNRRYGFALGDLLIRAPKNAEEIREEGRTLKHCVGGYAERHMARGTTILFLRRAETPEQPFCTIEMNKNQLVQIHGFKNEGVYSAKGRFAPDPREVHREFLDTWLAWLEAGSRRGKDGKPALPKAKQKKEDKIA